MAWQMAAAIDPHPHWEGVMARKGVWLGRGYGYDRSAPTLGVGGEEALISLICEMLLHSFHEGEHTARGSY